MVTQIRSRFWVEAVFGGVATCLGMITLFWRDWIEAIFGVNPDHNNGALEWLVVGFLFATALVLGLFARAEWRSA
jgi:hypothetical protein